MTKDVRFVGYDLRMKESMDITPGEALTRRSFLAGAAVLSLALSSPMRAAMENVAEDTVFELRQYTLYGDKRDTLISLFEKNFIDSQDAVGSHVIGTFRDLDDPDRFVWLRGFRDMQARQQALDAFYGRSAAWLAHKKEANTTMVDSDNVLLLRPVSAPPNFGSAASAASGSHAIYSVTIYYLGGVDSAEFEKFFTQALLPRLSASGVHPIATLTTDEVPNNYPRLPIREHDRVFLWIARWPDENAYASFAAQMRGWSGWRDKAPEAVLPAVMRKPEQLRLQPTMHSPLQ
jgi:NIPSNAP